MPPPERLVDLHDSRPVLGPESSNRPPASRLGCHLARSDYFAESQQHFAVFDFGAGADCVKI